MDHADGFGCRLAGSRFFEVNALRLHGLEWGDPARPPLLFLHGGSAHCHWWDEVAPAFADRYHVVSLDQRGHGASQWSDPPAYGTRDFVFDLAGLMERLGWERMVLVGHSMGGHNAMTFAGWHPERLSAVVIVDSRPAIPPERLERMRHRGHRILRPYENPDQAMERFRLLPPETSAPASFLRHLAQAGIVEREGKWFYRFDPSSNGSRAPVDAWPLLPQITCPTLIVRGEFSPIMPVEMARAIQEKIPGAQLADIPGAYHHLMLDQPEAFVSLLEQFLRGIHSEGASTAPSETSPGCSSSVAGSALPRGRPPAARGPS
jgi:pimeloyl-ACP methyl ester carboxylesterase